MNKTLLELHNEKIAALTPEQREIWEERAAIMEFCGNTYRLNAEIKALNEVLGRKQND
jgi:hypothetical protein